MNIDEAIKILKRDIHKDVPKPAYSARRRNEAVEMAVDVLAKQNPRRPIGITYTPNEVVIESFQYCAWCGQKLDWSEEYGEDI